MFCIVSDSDIMPEYIRRYNQNGSDLVDIDKHILKNINLTIDQDKFFVITGPNGAGTSTRAKIIMGIEKPTSGRILLDGKDSEVLDFLKDEQKRTECAALCYDEELCSLDSRLCIPIGRKDDLDEQAKRLFSALREADRLGAPKIYGHLPKKSGIGLALYNRMIRAAAHTVKKI